MSDLLYENQTLFIADPHVWNIQGQRGHSQPYTIQYQHMRFNDVGLFVSSITLFV